MTTLSIERVPVGTAKLTGKRCHYRFVVEGVDLGTVRGTIAVGCDRLLGRRQQRYWSYEAGGIQAESQDEAEVHLLGRQLTVINSDLSDEMKNKIRAHLAE